MITILAIGKTKQAAVQELVSFYLDRLQHYHKTEFIELSDVKAKTPEQKKLLEAEQIEKLLKPGDTLILCDERGKSYSSTQLAQYLTQLYNQSFKRIVLVIGGAYGFAESIQNKSQAKLSLSALTFPHDLARVILMEQLYRAHTILKNEPYHH